MMATSPPAPGKKRAGNVRSPSYLSKKLIRPVRTADGGTLHTVLDARTCMLARSADREHRRQWQRAAELLLSETDVAALTRQIELALFYEAKLVLTG